jgi:hypothetical protein
MELFMLKHCRSLVIAIASCIMQAVIFICEMPMSIVNLVAEVLTPQKLEAELEQNIAHKVTDSAKPVSIGSGSGESALSFVSMLKAINSRSFSAAA